MTDIPFTPLLAFGTLVFTFINFLKFLRARDFNSALTQAAAWVVGVAVTFLVSAASVIGSHLALMGVALNDLDAGSKVVFGLLAASLLSTLNEFKKAFDANDTAATPVMFPSLVPPEAPVTSQAAAQASARSHRRKGGVTRA